MQNYFVSNRTKTKKTLLIFVITALVLALCTLCALLFYPQSLSRKNADVTMHLQGYLKADDTAGYVQTKASEQKSDKMNKASDKNSKIYSSHDTAALPKQTDVDFIRLLQRDGSVISLPVEEYVLGCVAGEMPSSFHREALMAQAVAARTFAVRCKLVSQKHENADICTDYRCCQSYVDIDTKGFSQETADILSDAVNSTKGVIAVYDGQPILAAYHACSGEYTLSSKEVWGGDLPYLVSTSSPDGEVLVSASGNGHRVGMSQHGANILAQNGLGYAEILKYYYNGINLSFVS